MILKTTITLKCFVIIVGHCHRRQSDPAEGHVIHTSAASLFWQSGRIGRSVCQTPCSRGRRPCHSRFSRPNHSCIPFGPFRHRRHIARHRCRKIIQSVSSSLHDPFPGTPVILPPFRFRSLSVLPTSSMYSSFRSRLPREFHSARAC
jgi:hypothetical protein